MDNFTQKLTFEYKSVGDQGLSLKAIRGKALIQGRAKRTFGTLAGAEVRERSCGESRSWRVFRHCEDLAFVQSETGSL